jgi:putative nucleotidyltransferase with HDIG domain
MSPTQIRTLLLEDNPGDARLVQVALADYAPGEFIVIRAECLQQALSMLAEESFDIVLCDLGLPDSAGLATLEALAARTPVLPLVVLTGSHDEHLGREAIEQGAQDYLVKDEASGPLIARTLRFAIERKHLETRLRLANESLEYRVAERTAALQQANADLKSAFMRTINLATNLSEMRDPFTASHERRVAKLAVAIGAELGFDAHRQEGLQVAAMLHDVGKIGTPAEILSKPARLSPVELMLIQSHAQAGYDVLNAVGFPWPVAEVALQHHERMDGSGYPLHLCGDAIRLEARIMAVADVVEAMSSHRPYRSSLGVEQALAEIERGRGTAYDPAVTDACLRLFREKNYAFAE